MKLEPKRGFDWGRVAWGHPNSPQSVLCSYCFAGIGDDDVPLILAAGDGRVAQFCDSCMATWWGMRTIQNKGS